MVVIDGPIMSAEIFWALAGMLSIPADFDALRLRISEITSMQFHVLYWLVAYHEHSICIII